MLKKSCLQPLARLRARGWEVVRQSARLVIVCLVILGCNSPLEAAASPSSKSAPGIELVTERSRTAAFLAAYANADEAGAENLASPLYAAEWARRGLSVTERQALLEPAATSDVADGWLEFSWVGGMSDGRGFEHLLFTARPIGPRAGQQTSIWRVDTDASGSVIWLELVFLLAPDLTDTSTVHENEMGGSVPLPATLAALRPRWIVAVRSAETSEGYYVLAVPGSATGTSSEAPGMSVVYFGVDSDGQVRPGAWSYGQANPGPSTYGRPPAPHPVALSPELNTLERGYVATLCREC
jgi:hypothetical protein